jgi:hypothetical protein
MRGIRAALVAALATIAIAGCGGGTSAGPHSAVTACRDFRSWYVAQRGHILAGKDAPQLHAAVTESPSGHIYKDMSTLLAELSGASGKQRSKQRAAEGLSVIEAAASVEEDCKSVPLP